MIFKPWPIRVLILKRFGNFLRPVFDRARYEKRRIKTQNGIIEREYLVLKNQKLKIPAPEISYYYDVENVRWIYLLQLDRYTFYPCSFDAGKISVKVPVYEVDEKGNIVKDEKGRPKVRIVEKTIFDSRIALEDGRIVELPSFIAHKTYDKEEWLSSELEAAQRLYRSKSFWERYGNIVTLAVCFLFMVMVLYVGIRGYADLTKQLVDGMREIAKSYGNVANQLKEILRYVGKNVTLAKPPY